MSSRRKSVLLLLVSTSFSLLLVEFGYRWYVLGLANALSVEKLNSLHGTGRSGLIRKSRYLEIGYEFKPNLDTYFHLVPFETNSRGLRDREYALAKPRRSFRVAVVGDSFTVPAGIRIEDAYHSLLERWGNERSPDGVHEYVNFAVGGYSLRQYAAVLEHQAPGYDPDAILLGYCPENDHLVTPARLFRNWTPGPPARAFFSSLVLTGLTQILGPRRAARGLEPAEVAYLDEMFGKVATLASARSIPVVVVYLVTGPDDPGAARVEGIVEAHGLHFVDTSPAFARARPKEFAVHALDGHPNASAHEIYARVIDDYLTRTGLFSSPAKDDRPRHRAHQPRRSTGQVSSTSSPRARNIRSW